MTIDAAKSKEERLRALAKHRQSSHWNGYNSIGDYHGGAYECDYVSPITKAGHNVDAEIVVVLQDWSSDESLSRPLDIEARNLGYTTSEPTIPNLARHLRSAFGVSLSDVYLTNLFPFVKYGDVGREIPLADRVKAAREFTIPQIQIIQPRLVVCIGLATFNALRRSMGAPRDIGTDDALRSHFLCGTSSVWFQAHTGGRGQANRKQGGVDRTLSDWLQMATWTPETGAAVVEVVRQTKFETPPHQRPSTYTPREGSDPEKIHLAIATVNEGHGASAQEIAVHSGIDLVLVKREVAWALRMGVVRGTTDSDSTRVSHTSKYRPRLNGSQCR